MSDLTKRQQEILEAWNDFKKFPSVEAIAIHFDMKTSSVVSRMSRLRAKGVSIPERNSITQAQRDGHVALPPEFTAPVVSPIASADKPFEEIVEDRCNRYERKQKHENDLKKLSVKIPIDGPYGFVALGDPHVDDDGCYWPTLRNHIKIIQNTEALYAVNIGDTTNNWIGRLARLYANQTTSASEAWILAEGFIHSLVNKWLFIIGGNHDLWSGNGDPLIWITRQINALYQGTEARVALTQGKNTVVINARHNFPGHSMWNTAHSVGRSIQMGNVDHITIAGHRHTTGQTIIKAPNGRICHGVQIASYKVYDEYAVQGGFRDNNISPACLFVVDHQYDETRPAMITVHHDVEEGSEYLKFLRQKWKRNNTKALFNKVAKKTKK